MAAGLERLRPRVPGASRREIVWLLGAVAAAVVVRVIYALAMRGSPLAGDQYEYDAEGMLVAHGHLFWTRLPYGVLHAGAWKPPGYPAWLGFWYALAGHHTLVVRLAQVPFGAANTVLVWLLGRRLFGARVGMGAAVLVALYPLAFQYEELLYSEAVATPLSLLFLLLVWTGSPRRRRLAATGLTLGVLLLIRPSSVFLMLGALAFWILSLGPRRGALSAVAVGLLAIAVVAPWTMRNAVVLGGFLPVALDDAAAYGTFNAQAAADPVWPYAWRPDPPSVHDIFHRARPLSDIELHRRLTDSALSYISAHPASVLAAFYWNGLSRLWDVRRRSRSVAEVPFEGRSRALTDVGLAIYDVLLPLALLGLWRLRRQRAVLAGLLVIALGASIVFTADSGTRYRAPLEPLIALLAVVGVLGSVPPAPERPEPSRIPPNPQPV